MIPYEKYKLFINIPLINLHLNLTTTRHYDNRLNYLETSNCDKLLATKTHFQDAREYFPKALELYFQDAT